MFDSSPIIVGLELGTSKVCAVVGQANESGALNIIGGNRMVKSFDVQAIVFIPLAGTNV